MPNAVSAGRRLREGPMSDVIISTMPFLLDGLWMTFKISLITIFLAA